MTTTTAPATATTRTVHDLDLRVSDEEGLWAALIGHEAPVPAVDRDGDPSDADGPCIRRDCTAPAGWYVTVHRRFTRRDGRELVGLCMDDLAAHRAGETFLVDAHATKRSGRREPAEASVAA